MSETKVALPARSDIVYRKRRDKLTIYHEVLFAIQQESMNNGGAKPTRIQHLSNLSYDKLWLYLDELEVRGMIQKGNTLSLTEKGQQFLSDYDKVKEMIKEEGKPE